MFKGEDGALRKNLIGMVSAAIASVTLLVGCGATGTQPAATVEETVTDVATVVVPEDTAQTTAETTPEAGGERFGIVLKVLASEFWQSMERGINDKADELGVGVQVLAANSEEDVEGQLTVFQNMITSGDFDGFGVAPLTGQNLVNAVAEANNNGYLVVNIDEEVDPASLEAAGGHVVGFVTTDNLVVGRTAGEFIASQLEPGDEVAIIEGRAGAASGEARRDGAVEAFEAAGLNIVSMQPADWDRTRAFDLATNLINAHPNLRAIYAANDTMAMGAQTAVEQSGRDIIVVGTDGNSDAIESVKAGGLTATIAQDPAQVGARSLEMLVEAYRAGQTPGSVARQDVRIDPILITEDSN